MNQTLEKSAPEPVFCERKKRGKNVRLFRFFLFTLHTMKKTFLWIGGILLSPILIFLTLTILLYIPPIQNWLVDKVAAIASEETGMQIAVGEIDLDFPLDLGIDQVTVISQQGDTIANIDRMTVDVELLPLLSSKVVINELTIERVAINTLDLISDLQVKGTLDRLSAHSKGIDLNRGVVELNDAQLANADLTIMLSDTAAVDTTTSETPWLINIDSISISQSRVELHMPGDSMQIMAYMGNVKAREGIVNLIKGLYTVKNFSWTDGQLTYELPYEPPVLSGIDYNHIALSNIQIGIDSLYFCTPNLSLKIKEAAMREQSGLEISRLTGGILMDSTSLHLPSMTLATPYSYIYARAKTDFNVMDSINPGQLHLTLNAELGKPDLMLFMADMPQTFQTRWPDWPLTIKANMDGNMQQADIGELDITLPTALHASANGSVGQLTTPDQLMAQIYLEAETYQLDFITALAEKGTMDRINIPSGITLKGDIEARNGRYDATITAKEGKGVVRANGWFNQTLSSYDASINIDSLNLHHFLPKDSIYHLSATAKAKGQGFDFFKKTTWTEAYADVRHLKYGQLNIDSLTLNARLNDGHAVVDVKGNNQLLRGKIDVDALLDAQNLSATIGADLQQLDLRALQFVEDSLAIGMCGHIDIESNLEEYYNVTGMIGDLYIRDSLKTYRPQDFGLRLLTNQDTTLVRLQSGNLILKADATGGYQTLIDQFMMLGDTIVAQYKLRYIDQHSVKRNLPAMKLYLTSGNDNPIANFLRSSAKIDFKDVLVDITSSPVTGINGKAHIFSLNADSTRIDTIQLNLIDKEKGLTYQAVIANDRRNPQFVFRALIDGRIHEKGALAGLRYFDDRGQMGLRLGMTASMMGDDIKFQLLPERPTIGYKEFNLNKDNFLIVRQNLKLEAKVDLIADDGTGVKVYSESQDSTLLQDLTVSLYRFDLGKLTSVLPYMPRVSGILDGDYHLIMDEKKQISVASDMQVKNLIYEKNPIGNLNTEFVYLQREDETHAVEGRLILEDKEIGIIKGEYRNEGKGHLIADMKLEHFPMNIGNGFIPDQLIGFEGYAEGEMKIIGTTEKPKVDGEVYLDSAFLISKPYGISLRFDNDPVRIINSKLLLENFTMYAHNDNPLNIMGDIDFHDTERITMNVRMRAREFLLINSKQTKESIAYGKAYVNFFAAMNGRLDQLRMRGRLDVLGTTDLTYLLLDSPLSTDNHLEELVKFTDFNDSTQNKVEKPRPEGLDVNMNINIDQGAHVRCGLNADQSNYVDLMGGGDLRMKYDNEGITMTGRYTVLSGEMKYSLPIIPLKTFNIQDGSYVEFTGDPMNPRLNLTATERVKAAVGKEGEQSRSVAFDCGVVITKTLQDMGLEFIIQSPEDMNTANELNAMTTEERGKLAVTMLTTGMYLADGNTSGFSMNSALSSFLQSEINNITGNALKTLDLSVGLDNTTDASGNMHTDYSFKFAKRFWNNRLRVQIGGKVSTGNEAQGQKQSFFDNVTMEYRLTPTSNQYVKLFYNQNVYDWLEGYTGQYGGGYLWKRKLSSFWDIFSIWGNSSKQTIMPTTMPRREMNDSIKTRPGESQGLNDSIKTKRNETE